MAKFSGNSGNVTLSGTSGTWASGIVVNNIVRWRCSVDRGLRNSTTKGDSGDRSSIYGTKSARGTITMLADDTTALAIAAGSADPTVKLVLNGSRQFSGSAKMASMDVGDVDFDEGGPPEVTFEFEYQPGWTVA